MEPIHNCPAELTNAPSISRKRRKDVMDFTVSILREVQAPFINKILEISGLFQTVARFLPCQDVISLCQVSKLTRRQNNLKGISSVVFSVLMRINPMTEKEFKKIQKFKNDPIEQNAIFLKIQSFRLRDSFVFNLKQVVQFMPHLTYLAMGWYYLKIDDVEERNLSRLSSLTQLRKLECPSWIRDDILKNVSTLTNLTHLDLGMNRGIRNTGLQYLCGLSELTYLNLKGCDYIEDIGLQHLSGLVSLTELNFSSCQHITDAGLQHLRPLIALKNLNFGNCSLSSFDGLSSLTALRELDLGGNPITDDALQNLRSFTGLQKLKLSSCPFFTNSGLQNLEELTCLQDLKFYDCSQITDAGLESFSSLTALQELSLAGCSITGVGLQNISNLSLKKLYLNGCMLQDENLQYLKDMTSLNTLNLNLCRSLTDAGLQYLSGLSGLELLSVRECGKITMSGLQRLTSLLPIKRIRDYTLS